MVKRTPSQRLKTVLTLAHQKQQLAAVKLAESIQNVTAQTQQQQQLQQYQYEYSDQFKQTGTAGQPAGVLVNYLRFYNSLDSASEAQQQRVELASAQRDQAMKVWQHQYGRRQNLQKLIEKKHLQEERELEKKLQRELDDRKVITPQA